MSTITNNMHFALYKSYPIIIIIISHEEIWLQTYTFTDRGANLNHKYSCLHS